MQIRSLAVAMTLAFTSNAWALPATSVEWVQRTGSTNGTDAVEVWLRLTVTQLDGGPLFLNGTSTSFSAQDFETLSQMQNGLARIDKVYNNGTLTYTRGDTFCPPSPARGCSDPAAAWGFQFNRGANSFFAEQAEPIAPGQSRDYLLATFTPKNGPVAPGIYSFSSAELSIAVEGVDEEGERSGFPLRLGATCPSFTGDCEFTRTVTAVPEPETYALMGLGLLGVIGVARRQQTQHSN